VSEASVEAEASEHASDGVGLGGNLDPLHGTSTATAGADVHLPDVSGLLWCCVGVIVLSPSTS
jgi:hypothetical protein